MLEILLLMVVVTGVIFFGITQPIKKQKYDATVKYTSKFDVFKFSSLFVALLAMIGFIIYGIVETVSGYSRLYTILANNEALDSALRQVTFSESIGNQVVIPIMASIVLLIFAFVAIIYTLALAIYRLTSSIIAYKQQNNNETVRTLLKGFSNDNRSDVINAYFDMKSNNDKHKLFISQWKSIVYALLLDGEVKEAELLNSYIFEREKYCEFGNRIIRSNFKISLYDYEGLRKDKDRAMKIKAKFPKKKVFKEDV